MIEPSIPTAAPKPLHKRKATKPRAPRKPRDPGLVEIDAQFAAAKTAYRHKQASAKLLATFINKRLPKLTANDRAKLFDLLSKTETPVFPAINQNAETKNERQP